MLCGDDEYPQTLQIWHRAVQHRPALFAVCETSPNVQAAVRSGREYELSLSVRGGGHDWAVARALRYDGLVIDLSHMRGVDVDPEASVASPPVRPEDLSEPGTVRLAWGLSQQAGPAATSQMAV